jgi:hypothetical protein
MATPINDLTEKFQLIDLDNVQSRYPSNMASPKVIIFLIGFSYKLYEYFISLSNLVRRFLLG